MTPIDLALNPPTPHRPGGPDPARRPWYRRPTGWLLALIVAGSFVLWFYAFSGLARRDPPDTLDEAAYAAAAQPICAASRARIDALPIAQATRSPEERAAVLSDATDELVVMVDRLRDLTPGTDRDRAIVTAWLEDWDRYVADRRAYAAVLATGTDAQFVLTARNGEIYTKSMDNLATVNDMLECKTPGDV